MKNLLEGVDEAGDLLDRIPDQEELDKCMVVVAGQNVDVQFEEEN